MVLMNALYCNDPKDWDRCAKIGTDVLGHSADPDQLRLLLEQSAEAQNTATVAIMVIILGIHHFR